MAAEIAAVCGPREADGYLRFVDFVPRAVAAGDGPTSSTATWTPRPTCSTGNLLRLFAAGRFRRLAPRSASSSATPGPSGSSRSSRMYAGVAPQQALALYAVIAYLDSVAGVYFPRGGMHAVPGALAGAADKHGVQIRYGTTVDRVETAAGRATAVLTADGERIPADVVVLNPDLPVAYRDLLPALPPPGAAHLLALLLVVLHVGSTAGLPEDRPPQHPLRTGLARHLRRRDPTAGG